MAEEISLAQLLQEQQESVRDLSPAHQTGIQKLAPKHHAIMDYILANPSLKLEHVASYFGVSRPWLSTVIHSECFQALLQDKQRELFEVTALTLNDKITGLAHRAIERLSDKVEVMEDPKHLKDTAELALKSLGYGGKTTINAGDNAQINAGQVNNHIIQQARERMINRPQGAHDNPAISFDAEPEPTSIQSPVSEAAEGRPERNPAEGGGKSGEES